MPEFLKVFFTLILLLTFEKNLVGNSLRNKVGASLVVALFVGFSAVSAINGIEILMMALAALYSVNLLIILISLKIKENPFIKSFRNNIKKMYGI